MRSEPSVAVSAERTVVNKIPSRLLRICPVSVAENGLLFSISNALLRTGCLLFRKESGDLVKVLSLGSDQGSISRNLCGGKFRLIDEL